MGDTRKQIINKITAGAPSETVDVPDWNVKVLMRGMSAGAYMDMAQRVRKPDGTINTTELMFQTIIETAYDPDTGDRLFEDTDRDVLKQATYRAIGVLSEAASRVNGLRESESELKNEETSDS